MVLDRARPAEAHAEWRASLKHRMLPENIVGLERVAEIAGELGVM